MPDFSWKDAVKLVEGSSEEKTALVLRIFASDEFYHGWEQLARSFNLQGWVGNDIGKAVKGGYPLGREAREAVERGVLQTRTPDMKTWLQDNWQLFVEKGVELTPEQKKYLGIREKRKR